ncbi:general negative regulator of transcription subunit 3-like isoform X2 [Cynara cardunculus var. scolymus]|uniref:general negative regulator of transcription subunit 3-like isoform X2 n=1 Tax=Cynara cardunculus var. scolymus TaxID=59895 RepID=UPI000D623F57|nr:general negative regulator of transcription subunit 3-like isoform X2 [Cynara cardunculus var. scolymus]
MGASRKLQGEIDRVLKKVQEGVDVFDSIWNKVYDTDNANQKEKFEADLKKEIKKLQRYRDQIKTWIQSSEIKDKKVSASYEQALMDARKLIEREMERFKICEKETKTKAFSKEGLGQQPKTDPKEKAKSETRDWLNNTVSELESQIDSFEAEMEGLSVKKGKTRPPRLTHLESSIARHKAHIMKLELILRLLDNDELSPEQVNDVKDFIDDYVERNQEDFDEFEDVDMLYNTLSLDKVEALEDLVTIGPPGLVKGVGATGAVLSMKNALSSPPVQSPGASVLDQVEETVSQDNSSEQGARTPPPKSSAISSSPPTPTGNHALPVAVSATTPNLAASSILPGPTSVRGVLENTGSTIPSSPINNAAKEEEVGGFPVRKSSPALNEAGIRNLGRGSLINQSSVTIPISSVGSISTNGSHGVAPSVSEMAKRTMLGTDERLGSSGMVHPPVSSLSNRMILPQGVKTSDAFSSGDNGNASEAGGMTARVFSPSGVPGIQWRPGSSFQNQHEGGQFRGRTEIAPDQREKFLQRFQQVQQQGQSTLLGMPPISGGNHKQFSAQQNPLLQQFNPQSPTVLSQGGLGGPQPTGPNPVTSAQQPTSIHLQSGQQALMSTGSKDSEIGNAKIDEMEQQQSLSDDSAADPAQSPGHSKSSVNEEDQKVSYALDMQAGASGSLTEHAQTTRDVDLSPGQPLQSNQSASLGVIGRRSLSDLGAIGDNLSGLAVSLGGTHDQQYNLQMLEAAFYKLPQPKDSERAKSYTARHPAVTPSSYPQVQAPIVNNPAFWERLGSDNIGTDTLFFAFYYQQNTYQQYLAAKELKKQSWRYHKKYNTWFQRHEEPKFATDDYEQGTYVYFDFHIGNDEMQNGWCQRIKTDFKFEYNFLEDELIV